MFCYQVILCSILCLLVSVNGQSFPHCPKTGINLNISEAEPVGFIAYKLNCSDPDGDDLFYNLTYGNTFDKFSLENDTGFLKLHKFLNADFTYKYNLLIDVIDNSPSKFTTRVLIGVLVLNVNDNDPKILNLNSVTEIREDVEIGTKISTCSVKDIDSRRGSLAGETEVRVIDPLIDGTRRWVIDAEKCDLYVNSHLDYESQQDYNIIIEAYDLDPNPRRTNQSINIKIIDVNDNYPICSINYQIVNVSEDTPVGDTIAILDCSDLDSGVNQELYYRISDRNNSLEIKNHFNITERTGQVQIKTGLDYETSQFYDINIDVYDGGQEISLTTTVIVGVVISDVDDNVPVWDNDVIITEVKETTPLGTVVYVVSASDADLNDTAASTITYAVYREPDPKWLDVDTETGAVYVIDTISWSIAPWVTMEVLAYSSDKVNDFNTVTLNISIIDENNVAPRFDQVFYQGNISENDPIGTYIFTVRATDPEIGLNGQIEYSMNSPYFQIDPISGNITLKKEVDFETDTVFSLNVEASDKGDPIQRGYSFLLINVLPVNEFTPVIDSPGTLSIPENTEPGTLLYHFNVTDEDIGVDGSVTFRIQNSNVPFTIEPKTGILRVGSQLDRELISRYEIIVIAADSSQTIVKSSSAIVPIIITDINDHSPICEPLSNAVIKLPHQIGEVLTKVVCRDDDEGQNAEFTYTLISGDDSDSFSLGLFSGDLTLAKMPTQTKYTLSIIVEDRGDPKLDVFVAYNIIVELQFNFTNIPETLSIPENMEVASVLIDVDACCVLSSIAYELVNGNDDGHVNIDPSSGQLVLMRSFDREVKSSYLYTIKATSRDTNSTAESYVEIFIQDVNDNVPKFDTTFQYLSISEQYEINRSILKFSVTDEDEAANSQISYNIQSGNIDAAFFVSDSGVLSLNRSLDAETTSQYTLIVTASDGGEPSLTGTTTIFVDVKNVNEFSPQIVNVREGVIQTNVFENETLGAAIFSLLAEDRDVDTVLTYMIAEGNVDQSFVIDANSGTISLSKLLDRETTPMYNLTVKVQTSDNDTISAVVSIDVLDVNDKDPKFSQDVYQLEVTHEDPANTLVTSFIITDDDIGTNKDIASLEITDGDPQNYFRIEANRLLVNTTLDYYQQRLFTLQVRATDRGIPARSGTARVVVNVLPNFQPPQFLSNSYVSTVRENLASGRDAYDLDATSAGGREGRRGNIQYEIKSGNDANKFYISKFDGIVRVTSKLDFEETEAFTLVVEAKSREDGLLSSSTTLTINIENVNDNIPVFNSSVYNFVINEDAANGEVVGTVYADDADKVPYGKVSYSLGHSRGSTDFSVDSSGNIKVTVDLEYRRQNVYNIPIIASDGGVRQGEALVVIQLIDVNDNSPTFTPDNVTIDVSESSSIGLIFYTVKAEDLDIGMNGEIRYSFVSGNSDGYFGLNPDSGALNVIKLLDRETIPRFDLMIQAEDKAITGQRSGILSLTVNVADVNDQDPMFPNNFEDAVAKRADPPGVVVFTVEAEDRDSGRNARVNYGITGGNSDGLFIINTNTGDILTAASLVGAKNEYKLKITARDQGIPSRSGTTTIQIQIRPFVLIGTANQTLRVSENLPSGQVLGHITPRSGQDAAAVINYTMISGNYKDSFAINSVTGMVSTQRTLDREEYSLYILTVNIRDTFGNSYTQSVIVDVLDVNDNAPVITTNDLTINVVENTPAGQIVASFTVTDADEGPGGQTTLSISPVPISAPSYFEIRDNFLVVKSPIDYETVRSLSFNIFAVDGGQPQLTGSISVTIKVIDVTDTESSVNGEAPSVYLSTETSYLASNGELVAQLTAEDFGMTSNSITFTTLDTEGVFKVSTTGEVTVQKETLLVTGEKYFVWLVANGQSNNNKTSSLGLLRIDTFDPNYHVASLESSVDAETLQNYTAEMQDSLKKFFSLNDDPKIWKIIPYGSLQSRKLLASITETLVYVIKGPFSNDIADIEQKKIFMNVTDIITKEKERAKKVNVV